MSSRFAVLACAVAVFAAGCQSAATPASPQPTWYGAAKGVYARNCIACHKPGGAGPIDFTSYDAAKAALPTALADIASGRMPPWMPDPNCRHYQEERLILPADVTILQAWQAVGAPLGDPSEEPAPATQTAGDGLAATPDQQLQMKEPYTPSTAANDDYRCFLLGDALPAELFMTASDVLPGANGLVHHVLIFMVFPEEAGALQALDDADAGPGYTCFGGPGVAPTQTIAAWVPGATPQIMNPDSAVRLPKGARLVMQVHYNLQGHTLAPDESTLRMWLRPTAPQFMVRAMPVADLGLHIAAGDAHAQAELVTTNTGATPWVIVSAAGHMHRLGTEIKVVSLAASGTQTCLMDLPKWDFNWQQFYRFRTGEEVRVQPGEQVKMTCTWDNSASHQPIINGVQGVPKDVWWGESTSDEMCLSYLSIVEPYQPYVPTSADACKTFDGCFTNCQGDFATCILQCAKAAGNVCQRCVISGLMQCTAEPPPGVPGCGPQSQGIVNCLNACAAKGTGTQACVLADCLSDLTDWSSCAKPVIAAGACDVQQKACGISLAPTN